jgi:hypothetical protein
MAVRRRRPHPGNAHESRGTAVSDRPSDCHTDITVALEKIMSRPASRDLSRSLTLYAAGHAALLAGAWTMHVTGSMLPMALAASACLMLTVPLVRHFVARAAARRGV